jgi:hypothetical protein
LTKGIEQNSYAAQTNSDGQPVELFDQVFASRTLFDGVFPVLVGKDKSNTTFGSRGVARSNDLSRFQSGTSVIGGVVLSGVESIGSWGSPSRESGFFNQNGERVLGYEVIGSKPTNLYGSEWVMNFDSSCGEDNFWVNYKNPEDGHGSQAVDDGYVSFINHAGDVERSSSQAADKNNQSKISPVTSRAINIFVRHDGQTTTSNTKVSKEAVTKEGI